MVYTLLISIHNKKTCNGLGTLKQRNGNFVKGSALNHSL